MGPTGGQPSRGVNLDELLLSHTQTSPPPVLQCVAVRCSALQCVTVCCSVLQCVAVCCSVLQGVAVVFASMYIHSRLYMCVAVCVLQYVALYCSEVRINSHSRLCMCVAACCSVLQRVAVCCSVLQYFVAVCCREYCRVCVCTGEETDAYKVVYLDRDRSLHVHRKKTKCVRVRVENREASFSHLRACERR